MFYQAKTINSLLKCSICKEPFADVIKFLPCGHSACLDCCEANMSSGRKFKCKACGKMHPVPVDGFPNNLCSMQMLGINPEFVSRSEKAEKLKQLLNEIQSGKNKFIFELNNKEQIIKDYCSTIRYQIDLNHESFTEHLNKLRENQLKTVEKYEKELVDSLKASKENKEEQEDWMPILVEIDSFERQCMDYLDQVKLDETELEKAIAKVDELCLKLNENRQDFTSILFCCKKLELIQNTQFCHPNQLGFFKISVIPSKRAKTKLAGSYADSNIIFNFQGKQITSLVQLKNNFLATASLEDNSIRIWEMSNNTLVPKMSLIGHTAYVTSLQVLKNGNLASGSDDKTIKIWDPITGSCLYTLSLKSNQSSIDCLALLNSPHENQLASASSDNTINIWDLNTKLLIKTLNGRHTETITCLVSLPNGLLASCSYDGTIKIWKVSDGSLVRNLSENNANETQKDWFTSICLLGDGVHLASISINGRIKFWNFIDGLLVGGFKAIEGKVNITPSIIFLPNGYLACRINNKIMILNPNDGSIVQELAGHLSSIKTLVLLSNQSLATSSFSSSENSIKIWNFSLLATAS